MHAAPPGAFSFGPFVLDTGSYRLLRGDKVVQVSPKIIDLLLYLVMRPSVLVTKDELFKALWPDVAVTDNALTQAVSELRQALGDDPSNAKYVQTVARRGYRFVGTVVATPSPTASTQTDPQPAASMARGPAVGVLDFTNVSNDASLAWMSSGIAETLTNDLRSALQLRIIDRTRVVEAVRHVGTDLDALRRELHIDLAIVGSFQRAGNRLRITARAVDVGTGEALADSKADGLLDNVFDLQDRVVAQLAETIGTNPAGRRPHRETSSLEAYQAFTEGRLKLETLDGKKVVGAIDRFERAIQLDPHYAAAYVGLANARFWQYRNVARAQSDRRSAPRAGDRPRPARDRARN